ncbi:MAG TPA: hypothetical protein VID31_01120 [Streptosporangiaceae bacterium]
MTEDDGAAGPPDTRRPGYWLPLTLCGLLLAGGVALYAVITHWTGLGPGISAGPGHSVSVLIYVSPLRYFPPPTSIFTLGRVIYGPSFYYVGWYWAVALAAVFLFIVLWYRRPGRRPERLRRPGRGYLVTAIALLVLALALPLLTQALPVLAWVWLRSPWVEGIPALLIIMVGLGALARAGRNRALAWLTAAYAVVVLLVTAWLAATPEGPFQWQPILVGEPLSFSPVYALLLPAAVLVTAGVAALCLGHRPGWRGRRPGHGRLPA